MVSDAKTKSPINGASVSISVIYASGSTKKSFSGTTDSSGKVSFSFPIGFNSTPGIFTATVHASKSSFVVIKIVRGPICPRGIDTCPPCSIKGNQKGVNCVPPSPPPCDSKNQTCTSPPTRCGDGTHYDDNLKKCIPKCDSGYHYDDAFGKCVSDIPPTDPCIENPSAEGCELQQDDGILPPPIDTDTRDSSDSSDNDSGDSADSSDSSVVDDGGDGGDTSDTGDTDNGGAGDSKGDSSNDDGGGSDASDDSSSADDTTK